MAKKKMTFEEKLEEAIVKDAPYEVPDNWIWSNVGSISLEIKNGTTIKQNKDEIGIKVTRIESLQNNGIDLNRLGTIIETEKIKEQDYYIDGDIALSHINSLEHVGKTALIDNSLLPLVHGMNLLRIRVNKRMILPKYFQLYTRGYDYKKFVVDRVNRAVNQVSLNQKNLSDVPMPIPPLKEQQRIVDKIESLFEKLDKAKELIEEVRDDFEKRKSAILEKAFRGELTKVWRKENNINREWKREKLKDITKITSGGTPSRKHPEYFEGKIPWIKTGEILWNKIYDSEEHITEEAIANSSAKLIPEGAVLVAMYGQGLTRGRASILEKEACTNQAVCALIPSDAVLNSYLYYYFMSNYWRFRQVAKGGNQENLSGKVIGAFEIDIPSIEEQNEIVRILDKLLEEESKIEELTTLEEQIELIKKSILAKAFRGQLGTNCEDDESALELLKEILNKK